MLKNLGSKKVKEIHTINAELDRGEKEDHFGGFPTRGMRNRPEDNYQFRVEVARGGGEVANDTATITALREVEIPQKPCRPGYCRHLDHRAMAQERTRTVEDQTFKFINSRPDTLRNIAAMLCKTADVVDGQSTDIQVTKSTQ